MTEPQFRHGKICYLMMPTRNVDESARFYRDVFDWTITTDGAGNATFDDAVGQVSGMWMPDWEPATQRGIEIHIMVANAEAVERAIVDHGGSLVWKSGPDESEVYGTFRDPSGNLMGYYQQAGLDS